MRRIEWTQPARLDLAGIDGWLTQESDPETAEIQLRHIIERAEFLRDFPHGGPVLPEGIGRYLKVRGTPYRLHYRVVGADLIQILRIYHVRQQWPEE